MNIACGVARKSGLVYLWGRHGWDAYVVGASVITPNNASSRHQHSCAIMQGVRRNPSQLVVVPSPSTDLDLVSSERRDADRLSHNSHSGSNLKALTPAEGLERDLT